MIALRAAAFHLLDEDQHEADIADADGAERPQAHRLAEEQRPEDHHEERIGEQDQPLELGGDEFQSEEIGVAGEPVAEHADQRGLNAVFSGGSGFPLRRRSMTASTPMATIDRHRQCHAERQQGGCIHRLGIDELDRHRLGREEDRADGGEGIAEFDVAPARTGGRRPSAGSVFGRGCHRAIIHSFVGTIAWLAHRRAIIRAAGGSWFRRRRAARGRG